MMQIVYCECGEASMLDGRCIKCKKVRPTSKELLERLVELTKDTKKVLDDLEVAIKLEIEDGTTIQPDN